MIATHWLAVATADRFPITAFVLPAETRPIERDSTRSRFLECRISLTEMSHGRSSPDPKFAIPKGCDPFRGSR